MYSMSGCEDAPSSTGRDTVKGDRLRSSAQAGGLCKKKLC